MNLVKYLKESGVDINIPEDRSPFIRAVDIINVGDSNQVEILKLPLKVLKTWGANTLLCLSYGISQGEIGGYISSHPIGRPYPGPTARDEMCIHATYYGESPYQLAAYKPFEAPFGLTIILKYTMFYVSVLKLLKEWSVPYPSKKRKVFTIIVL